MSKKNMPDFNSKLLSGSESQDNKDNQSWWQSNPMTYDWDKSLGEPVFSPLYFITKPLERLLAKRWGWYLEAKLTK